MKQHALAWSSWLLVVAMLGAAGCASTPPPTTQTSRVVAGGHTITASDLARRVHRQVNATRKRHGLSPVAFDEVLARVAAAHSTDMLRRNYFSHDSPEGHGADERYRQAGYDCRLRVSSRRIVTGGENLALSHTFGAVIEYSDGRRERTDFRSADEVARRVVDGWMNSPSHRRNMLTPFWRREGIGVALGEDGRVWVTQNFC